MNCGNVGWTKLPILKWQQEDSNLVISIESSIPTATLQCPTNNLKFILVIDISIVITPRPLCCHIYGKLELRICNSFENTGLADPQNYLTITVRLNKQYHLFNNVLIDLLNEHRNTHTHQQCITVLAGLLACLRSFPKPVSGASPLPHHVVKSSLTCVSQKNEMICCVSRTESQCIQTLWQKNWKEL